MWRQGTPRYLAKEKQRDAVVKGGDAYYRCMYYYGPIDVIY